MDRYLQVIYTRNCHVVKFSRLLSFTAIMTLTAKGITCCPLTGNRPRTCSSRNALPVESAR